MSADNSFIKTEQVLSLDQELDLQNCIEEFDRIIYQIPEEFASDFCDGDSNQNLTSEFTFNIGGDGDHGWVGLSHNTPLPGKSLNFFLIWMENFKNYFLSSGLTRWWCLEVIISHIFSPSPAQYIIRSTRTRSIWRFDHAMRISSVNHLMRQ